MQRPLPRTRTWWAFAVLLMGVPLPAEHAADRSVVSATAAGALPGGKPIELRLDLRDERVVAAIGCAPTYSRSPVEFVIVPGAGRTQGKLGGELNFRIGPDGYQPAAEGSLLLDDLQTVVRPSPAPEELARLVLDAESVMRTGDPRAKPNSRRMQFVFAVRGGRAFGAKAIPPGSLTDVGCAPHITSQSITLVDGVLAGVLRLRVQPQAARQPAEDLAFEIDGRVIGDLATGRLIPLKEGKTDGPVGSFVGHVRWGAPPTSGDALYKLTIRDALGPGKFIDVYLAASGGRFRHGYATSPNFNNATHPVDVSGMRLEGSTITGSLGVAVQPDPWIPADGRPIECSFPVEAKITDGEIEGKAGAFVVEGSLTDRPSAAPAKQVTLKLENALHGTGGWKSRAFVSCELDGGRVVGGRVTNNHTRLQGKVTGGELSFEDNRLTGKIEAEVTRGDGAGEGAYRFEVDVQMVGAQGAGTFVSRSGDRERRGRLWVTTSSRSE